MESERGMDQRGIYRDINRKEEISRQRRVSFPKMLDQRNCCFKAGQVLWVVLFFLLLFFCWVFFLVCLFCFCVFVRVEGGGCHHLGDWVLWAEGRGGKEK